jgi:hypothetical protein
LLCKSKEIEVEQHSIQILELACMCSTILLNLFCYMVAIFGACSTHLLWNAKKKTHLLTISILDHYVVHNDINWSIPWWFFRKIQQFGFIICFF